MKFIIYKRSFYTDIYFVQNPLEISFVKDNIHWISIEYCNLNYNMIRFINSGRRSGITEAFSVGEGHLHSNIGPSVLKFDSNGNAFEKQYFVNGEQIDEIRNFR